MTGKHFTRRQVLQYLGQGGVASGIALIGGCSNSGRPPGSVPALFDTIVYGATPGGIMAALAAARAGLNVALIEPTMHVGGMLSSGLGQTDSLFKQYIGGLTAQFYLQVGAYYGTPGTPGYLYEPHVAEKIFNQLLTAANVTVYLGGRLASLVAGSQAIQAIVLDNNNVLIAPAWIDASYEGDLMASAKVSYRVGREAVAEYQESHAGWARSTLATNVSPLEPNGALIPDIHNNPSETRGSGDAKIMAYSFRSCLTTDPSNMAPFPRPQGYDPRRYLGLQRSIAANGITKLSTIVTMSATINHKYDLLRSENPFSVNLIGGGWSYPDASFAARASIVQDHYNYVAGWLYFIANDPSIPASIQSEIRTYGLARDEFTDNGNWPYQLYIREARRMLGQYIMTEADITTSITKPDCVAIGTWYGDCHPCDSYSSIPLGAGDSSAVVDVDGELDVSTPAYQIPYRCLLPKTSQPVNLAVVCCPSSSHVAFCSLRVEPSFMMLGEAAGTAAGLCATNGGNYSSVDVATLQNSLTMNGGILSL